MNYDPKKHRRRTIRLKGYDYRQAGAYFVTICTQNQACLFGDVMDGEMQLNDAGGMVERWWFELNGKFSTVETDEFAVMPNHFHGIVVITDTVVGADLVGADLRVGPVGNGANPAHWGTHVGAPLRGSGGVGVSTMETGARPTHQGAHAGAPLPAVIQWFKTMTTNEYIRGVKTASWPSFNGRLWQRNYYEHVIRDDDSLNRIRQYIIDNPLRWAFDRENPAATAPKPEEPWLA